MPEVNHFQPLFFFFPLKIPKLVWIWINNCLFVESKVIIIKMRGGEDNLFVSGALPNPLGKTNFIFVR